MAGVNATSLKVSNPLRLEGDHRVAARFLDLGQVSNPLRLEGDMSVIMLTTGVPGWFLIHYGWRGTPIPELAELVVIPLVSNPLRLEGDPVRIAATPVVPDRF